MTNCSRRPPTPWNAETAAIARCKKPSTASVLTYTFTTVLRWTCYGTHRKRGAWTPCKRSIVNGLQQYKLHAMMLQSPFSLSLSSPPRERGEKKDGDAQPPLS